AAFDRTSRTSRSNSATEVARAIGFFGSPAAAANFFARIINAIVSAIDRRSQFRALGRIGAPQAAVAIAREKILPSREPSRPPFLDGADGNQRRSGHQRVGKIEIVLDEAGPRLGVDADARKLLAVTGV